MSFPWELGEKPYFINPEGFEWYVDKETQQYANRRKCKNVGCFLLKKENYITRAVIDDKQNVLYESQSLEAIGSFLDVLPLVKN